MSKTMGTSRIDNMWTSATKVAKTLKGRSEQHIARKVFHASGVALIIFLYHILERQTGLAILGTFIALIVPLDFMRRNLPWLNELAMSVCGSIMRKEEEKSYSGVTFLVIGAFVIIYLFPKDVVVLSLAMLGLGDPISSIVGTRFGKDKLIGNKSIQGTLACMITCSIIAAVYFVNFGLMTERVVLVSILSGIIGAFSELVPVGKLDDNLTFPVICATLLYGLFFLFGGF